MFHLGAPPTVIRVASLYQIFRTASAAGSDPAGEPSRGYDPDMMRAIDAWRANAGVSAADPVPNSPPTQPSTSTGPSRITRRVLQPKQIAVKLSPLRPQCAGARRFETWTPPASAPRSSSLPTVLEKQTRAVAVAGLADSTKEKYSTALASWHAYSAACGFWGLCRIGELTVSPSRFDPRYHATRTSVRFSHTAGGIKVLILRLPRTKTQPFGETVVLPARHLACDPVLLLQTHLAVSPSADPARTALFAYRHGRGHRVRTRSDLLAGALEALAGNDPELRGLLDAAEAHGRASAPLANARAGVHRGNVVPYERDAREQLDFIQTLASQTGSAHASAGTQSGFRRQQ
ncbi:unnamed protein product [Tilletia laevis]|uniref:Uncharacterized protein n=1 Tax=Tilletia laevis TaxID=157183 RepID=A0A9N8QBN1_9BASI|nr:unnamed protein product [Tilletia laevis]